MAWKVSKPKRWIIGVLAVLAILLLYSEHERENTSTATGSTQPCTVMVTADALNARSSPDGNAPVVDTYHRGEVVSADRTITNGFRQLAPGRWVAAEFVDPTPGSNCG
ncbi:MAG TPA: SH3 domain-containing protein [Pseudonocardiaceae bacterium]|nr:SH3 domain-containing protein [Pseudonocardiaceae bacterium]